MAIQGLQYIISLNDQLSGPLKEVMKDVDALGNSLTSIASIGAAFAGATIGIGAFVDKNLTALDEIHQLSKVTGVAANDIYELGKVAEVNGSSSAAAQASIEGLSKTIGEAVTGVGKGAKAFEKFGIAVKNQKGQALPFNNVLDNIMGKMSQMDEASQIAMLAKLGIDKTMIQTLRLGSAELENVRRKANALSLGVGMAENAQAAAEFKDALTLVTQVIKGAGEYISVRLAPYLKNIMELFTDWYIVNNDLVKNSLNDITAVLGNVLKFIFKTVQAIDRILQATIGWKGALIALAGAFVIVKNQMIFNPLTKMATGILALILLVDDLIVYMKGGKSYFGSAWQPLIDVIQLCQAQFAKVKPYISAVYDKLKPYLPMIIGIVAGIKVGAYVLSGIGDVFGSATKAASLFFKVFKAGFFGNPIGIILTALTTLGVLIYQNWDVCSAFFSDLSADIKKVWGDFTNWLSGIKQWCVELGAGVKNIFNNIFISLKNMFIDSLNWIIKQANKLGGVIGVEIPLIPTVQNDPVIENAGADTMDSFVKTSQIITNSISSTAIAPTTLEKPNGKAEYFPLPENTKAKVLPMPQGSVSKSMTMNQNNSKTVHIGSIVVNEATDARQLAQQIKDNAGLMA